MSEALLRLDGLVAGHRAPVVGPLSFALGRGEVLGLWGGNGSGKSTLLNAIARAARVFAGTIRRAPGLRLSYQEQRPVRLDPMPMTGADLLRAAGLDPRRAPAPLVALLGQRLDRLSGGQYQLLCVWCALGAEVDLVLLDEPTNNLDPGAERSLRALLETARADRAVLLVSHERAFLEAVSTRVLTLEAGGRS
ncbi:ATP-binding cassette domain-containing protein [Marichromatium bheemlicum]|uniref:ATP-binding cassette domain-containing protein n=1 Tax=Marichromatium bheemlicum TaxID=365339 RepID=A0ABX1I5N0_9GAMM|nr:ATP-binding cassette domain-containing protein [Marichromatium bheemlicum]NKN32461.1 ATP-binding cassette domain-containing protein [Marichromatium bheemlicum]